MLSSCSSSSSALISFEAPFTERTNVYNLLPRLKVASTKPMIAMASAMSLNSGPLNSKEATVFKCGLLRRGEPSSSFGLFSYEAEVGGTTRKADSPTHFRCSSIILRVTRCAGTNAVSRRRKPRADADIAERSHPDAFNRPRQIRGPQNSSSYAYINSKVCRPISIAHRKYSAGKAAQL